MFSKPLFKQSLKANSVMWAIVTALTCFMLACVMIIGGSGTVGNLEAGVTDTIITHEIESSLKQRSLSYYGYTIQGEHQFDVYFSQDLDAEVTSNGNFYAQEAGWVQQLANNSESGIPDCYNNISTLPTPSDDNEGQQSIYALFRSWALKQPQPSAYDLTTTKGQNAFALDTTNWIALMPSTSVVGDIAGAQAYQSSVQKLQSFCLEMAQQSDSNATMNSSSYLEISGTVFVTINPGNQFDTYYTNHALNVPEDYDITSLAEHYVAGDLSDYINSSSRMAYIQKRASSGSSVFLGDLFTRSEAKQAILSSLSEYGVDEAKYDSFGYDFERTNNLGNTTTLSYQAQIDHEIDLINQKYANGEYANDEEYLAAIRDEKAKVANDLSASFMSLLPTDIADALKEIGKMDVYSLIVGSIYYKMAGLLLPIIYVIMAANSLISSQVDTGSMAYVLSTSTKRTTVSFTQIVYLLVSLLGMVICTTLTSFICFSFVDIPKTSMTYSTLALMNLGMFAVLVAIAGFNFMTSSIFDRQKRSMSVGGGLSIFALVATMLGLFGSKEIPSVVRFTQLNYFNYVSIISLFDVPSIVGQTSDFIWKMLILFTVGAVCFVIGSIRFKKKDLPL